MHTPQKSSIKEIIAIAIVIPIALAIATAIAIAVSNKKRSNCNRRAVLPLPPRQSDIKLKPTYHPVESPGRVQ